MADIDALYASDGIAPAVRATVSSQRLPTDMDLITDSVMNWPHKGIATSGTPDDDGVIIEDTVCVFEYVLTGTIIHITGFAPGYYDVGHEENQIVIIKPTTYHMDSLVDALGEGGASVTIGDTPPPDAEPGDLWGDTSDTGLNSIVVAIGSMLMPIGTMYSNKVDTRNPSVIFGFGTWVPVEGYTIVGRKAGDADFGTAGATLGAKAVTLTNAQMPAHTFNVPHIAYAETGYAIAGGNSLTRAAPTGREGSGTGSNGITTGWQYSFGQGQAHNNIQPSVVAYMWERTA